MEDQEDRTSIIGVIRDGIKYKLDRLPTSTILDWFFDKRVVVEKAFFGEEFIYSIRLKGDRYFVAVDDEEHELFGEPTHFEYWIINENKPNQDAEPDFEIPQDGEWEVPIIEKGTYVIGRTTKQLNFSEVTADKLDVICTGITDDLFLGHKHEWMEYWNDPEMDR